MERDTHRIGVRCIIRTPNFENITTEVTREVPKKISVPVVRKADKMEEKEPETEISPSETEGPKPPSKVTIKVVPKAVVKKCAQYPKTHTLTPRQLLVSYDIGIVNLAYCVMSCDDGDILDWNIISLVDGNSKLMCSGCVNKAYYKDPKDPKAGLCKRHGHNKGFPRNLTTQNVTETELKKALFQALDTRPQLLVPHTVLIENQRVSTEVVKRLSHSIFDYYILNDLRNGNGQIRTLEFVNACHKLTLYEGPPLSCPLKGQHPRNKWYGKQYCRWLLEKDARPESKEALVYFDTFAKRDDLADAYLQACWYLKYGRAGLKAPTGHQIQARADASKHTYKTVKARKPLAVSTKKGRYSLANIKYLMEHGHRPESPTVSSAIQYHFGSVDAYKASLEK